MAICVARGFASTGESARRELNHARIAKLEVKPSPTAGSSLIGFGPLRDAVKMQKNLKVLGAAAIETSVSPEVVQSIQATENVWRAIEAEFGLLSSTEVSTAVGCSTPNRSFAYYQRMAGRLIAVSRPEGLRFPGFQCDPVNRTVRRVKKDLVSAARNAGRSDASLTLWLNTLAG